MKKEKLLLLLLAISVLMLNSCSVHNRMTSPETLKKEQRAWTVGVAVDPAQLQIETDHYNDPLLGIQPVIGYRTGLGKNQDIGITIYGVSTPALVIDYKHQILNKNNFLISGDAAVFGGYFRPIGLQYDLIFGKRQIYGVAGINHDFTQFISEHPLFSLGIGSERIANSGFGIQVAYARGIREQFDDFYANYLSVGLKFDFLRTKKKFRK